VRHRKRTFELIQPDSIRFDSSYLTPLKPHCCDLVFAFLRQKWQLAWGGCAATIMHHAHTAAAERGHLARGPSSIACLLSTAPRSYTRVRTEVLSLRMLDLLSIHFPSFPLLILCTLCVNRRPADAHARSALPLFPVLTPRIQSTIWRLCLCLCLFRVVFVSTHVPVNSVVCCHVNACIRLSAECQHISRPLLSWCHGART